MDNIENTARCLKRIRTSKQLSQSAMARMLNFQSAQHISNLERNKLSIRFATVLKYAKQMKLTEREVMSLRNAYLKDFKENIDAQIRAAS